MSSPFSIDAIRSRLSSIAGVESVRPRGDHLTVSPADTEEVAAILRYANTERIAVEPCGGGTKRPTAAGPEPLLHLSTERMNAVREHTWQDLTCTVDAGCTWHTMQSTLAEYGQFVALDPLYPERATVGGILATNDSGSLRLKYGSLRDLVIGMTIVLADGTIAKSGGKVVKNVAGYDLHKLMIGAEGTLGVITEVTFRLHAIPRHTRSFAFHSSTPEPLGELLLSLLNSHLNTQAMQLRNSRDGFHCDVQLATLPEVISHQAEELSLMAKRFQLDMVASSEAVWQMRQTVSSQRGICTMKATMLPSQIPAAMAAIHALGGTAVTQAGGIMIANTPPDADGIHQLRVLLEESQSSLTILRDAPQGLDRWGKLPDSIDLMRRIHHQFDPNNILNPGRFIGGI